MQNQEEVRTLSPRAKKIIAIILAVAILAGGAQLWWFLARYRFYSAYKDIVIPPDEYVEGQAFVPAEDTLKAVPGFTLAAINDSMALYVKQDTAEVAVYDRRSGKTVYSNPSDASKDPIARTANQENLKSQFILSYMDSNAKEGTAWSSYAKAVANGQVEYESIPGGVRVIYNLSNERLLLVPDVLTKEWYDILSVTGRKMTARSYDLDEESGLYIIKTQGVTLRNKQMIDQDARTAGFSLEDYEEMQALRISEGEEKAESLSFTVALEWRLTEDGVEVCVPYGGIHEFGGGKVRTIQLLPFLGAGGSQESGYIVLPEGSGALMRFNNGKSSFPQYNKNVYDLDLVDSDFTAIQYAETARMAMFGIVHDGLGILATCERGASLANIVADVAGRNNSYNFAYFSFTLRRSDTLMITNEEVNVAEKDLYPVDCKVRYALLAGENTGYDALAAAYRQRLIREGALTAAVDEGDIPFYSDIIGGVKETAHFMGIQYLRVLPMTTFKNAGDIIQALDEAGVKNQRINLQGWMNGGYYHNPVSKLSVLSKLGGKSGLSELNRKAEALGAKVYPDAAVQLVTDIAKGFKPSQEASRYYAEGYVVKLGVINPVTLRRTGVVGYNERAYMLLSPKFLPRYAASLASGAEKLGLNSLSLRDLASEVHADKRRTNVINREYALDLVKDAFSTIKGSSRELMVSGGNDYSFPYASHVINAPLNRTPYPILDEEIPLWEMIVHGSIEYCGKALNLSQTDDRRAQLLHLVEYGASVHYTFTWKDAAEMKYTGLNENFATTFSSWKDAAAEDYAYVNGALKHVRGAQMSSFERLSDTLSRTCYSNGTEIYINYADEPAQAGTYSVPARDYLVVGGDAK
ncbi:MAG: hypothetical protein K5663_05935 [Clostridiales bacterium]|nr:hypothetical protein [Clostridiales bacterium]